MSKPKFTSKVCPVCGIDKLRSEYYKKGEGVSHKCKECSLKDNKTRQSKYIGKYDERQNKWRRIKYNTDESYKEKTINYKKFIYSLSKERINKERRERWANDLSCPDRKHNRLLTLRERTPKWSDLALIDEIYKNCPSGYQVDHVIPLRGLIDGRKVTGLHVPNNLQYLTQDDNLRKYNKISEQHLN